MLQTTLFQDEWGVDTSPVDDTQIVQFGIFMDRAQLPEFKKLAKQAVKEFFPTDYIERGNVSDAIILLLKKHYGNGIRNDAGTTGEDEMGDDAGITVIPDTAESEHPQTA